MAFNKQFQLYSRALVAAILAALVCYYVSGSETVKNLTRIFRSAPKAGVEQPEHDLGLIESPPEFTHSFTIRNQGRAPLVLARGPSACSCTVSDLPDGPISPGGKAHVKISFSDSAKKDELKSGPFSESVTIRTNDPDRENIVLKLSATVRRPLEIEPSPLTLSLKAADCASKQKRSVEAYVFSRTWDRFDLAAANKSRQAIECLIDPATEGQLKRLNARSAYRVVAILPPDMPGGEFKEWLELSAAPGDAIGQARNLKLQIQGKIEGRLALFGPKVDSNQVLRLGILNQGDSAKETLLMKVDDPRRALSVNSVETEPDFIRVQVFPLPTGSAKAGLYRIEVEIPGNARPCNYMGEHPALIRINTDHPLFPEIDVKVSLAVVAMSS